VSCVGIITTESLNRPWEGFPQTGRLYAPTVKSVISAILCDGRGYDISEAGRLRQRSGVIAGTREILSIGLTRIGPHLDGTGAANGVDQGPAVSTTPARRPREGREKAVRRGTERMCGRVEESRKSGNAAEAM
jgi:hypothetical protein